MSIPLGTTQSVCSREGFIVISMDDGEELRFPVAENARLAAGIPEQLGNIELSPFGLYWPDLDEDLSLRGIMAGDYGQSAMKRLG